MPLHKINSFYWFCLVPFGPTPRWVGTRKPPESNQKLPAVMACGQAVSDPFSRSNRIKNKLCPEGIPLGKERNTTAPGKVTSRRSLRRTSPGVRNEARQQNPEANHVEKIEPVNEGLPGKPFLDPSPGPFPMLPEKHRNQTS